MATTFSFAFDPRYSTLFRVAGITPERASLTVDDHWLSVRFGIFTLETALDNVSEASVTGPHQPLKALGVRMSLADRGLTFGSSTGRMTCILFRAPVRISPFDVASHPGLSVSVDRPDELATLLNGAR